jgi:hypothetical protein
VAYVEPGSSRRLTKTLGKVQKRSSIPRWAALAIVISPLLWLLFMVGSGIAFSGFAHLATGAILLIVGIFALATPAAIYGHGFLARMGTWAASFVATLTGALAVPSAWLAAFGQSTRAVVTGIQATPGCTTRNSGCYGDVRLTLRAVNGSARRLRPPAP